jgi:hypothetical protein
MKKLVEQSRAGFSLPDRSNFWEYFPTKHVIQGRPTKNYSVDCIQENHQKFCLFSILGFPATPKFLQKKKHKKLFALKSTHRALAQNPPLRWQPKEKYEEKNRSAIINEI